MDRPDRHRRDRRVRLRPGRGGRRRRPGPDRRDADARTEPRGADRDECPDPRGTARAISTRRSRMRSTCAGAPASATTSTYVIASMTDPRATINLLDFPLYPDEEGQARRRSGRPGRGGRGHPGLRRRPRRRIRRSLHRSRRASWVVTALWTGHLEAASSRRISDRLDGRLVAPSPGPLWIEADLQAIHRADQRRPRLDRRQSPPARGRRRPYRVETRSSSRGLECRTDGGPADRGPLRPRRPVAR